MIVGPRVAGAVALMLLAAVACGSTSPDAPAPQQLNVVVLLDLSDRIDPSRPETRDQAAIDREVVRQVVEAFEDEVKRKKYVFSRDKLQVVVAPQSTEYHAAIIDSAPRLRIDLGRLPVGDRRRRVPALKRELLAQVGALYDKATSASRFAGADIWSFFLNNLEDYLPCAGAGERTRNVLVVLTDGYLDFEEPVQRTRPRHGQRTSFMQVARYRGEALEALRSPGHGLIASPNDAARCLEVLILEMTERKVGDHEVLQAYWGKWLGEMNVSRFELKMSGDSPAQMRDVVDRFLGRTDSSRDK